jgi:hypothetical protein
MATDAASVIEIRTGGSDTNGGGFVTGASGTDHTLQDAAQYAVSDGVTDGTTTITSATASFGTDVVGNWMYVTGGTGSVAANRYEITARASSTSITVDRSTGLTAGTGVTLNIGGALASPGELGSIYADSTTNTSGTLAYMKAGTYTLTGTTINIAGGPIKVTQSKRLYLEGYSTTRGDGGTRPVIDAGAQTGIAGIVWSSVSANDVYFFVYNIEVDGNSGASNDGFRGANSQCFYAINCLARDCPADGFRTNGKFYGCRAVSCGDGFSVTAFMCVAESCTNGFTVAAYYCLGMDSTTSNFRGGFSAVRVNCTGYNSGAEDFYSNSRGATNVNCLSVNAGTYAFRGANSSDHMVNCAHYNATSGRTSGTFGTDVNAITLTGDPFEDAAGDDYRLNNTAGAGADCRAAGITVPNQTDVFDVGVHQHYVAAAGGGGTSMIGPGGGMIGRGY